MKRSFHYHF